MREQKSLHCRLCPYDVPPECGAPKRGDYLVSIGKRGKGSGYLILRARRVKRRRPAANVRWSLECQRVPVDEAVDPQWWLVWYPRDRKRPASGQELRTARPRGPKGARLDRLAG